MKGEIINCSAHKDIYFLETNPTTAKSESPDLASLFASPAGREMFKYKSRPKLKQKLNPALEFVIQSNTQTSTIAEGSSKASSCRDESKLSTPSSTPVPDGYRSRRNSIDLYEEAASILGLTCSQTDDCKCLECQCHYFDFEDDLDFSSGSECMMDHSSSCSIQ